MRAVSPGVEEELKGRNVTGAHVEIRIITDTAALKKVNGFGDMLPPLQCYPVQLGLVTTPPGGAMPYQVPARLLG